MSQLPSRGLVRFWATRRNVTGNLNSAVGFRYVIDTAYPHLGACGIWKLAVNGSQDRVLVGFVPIQ